MNALALLAFDVVRVFACRLIRFLVCAWGEKHKTPEILGRLRYSYLIQTILIFPSKVCVDVSHIQ